MTIQAEARRPRSPALQALLVALGLLACAGFVALGLWQVQRLAWKEALIARVERNVHGPAQPAPLPADWAALSREDEYRRLQLAGRFDYQREVLVRASTILGAGYWVLTPLRTEAGHWVLVNRGFVPPQMKGEVPQGAPEQTVVGLLRPSEPGGGILQDNEPAAGRWYSRDVAAIAAQQGLEGGVAPFFVDAQPAGDANGQWPRPGLTVLQFTNNHLVYAITWFALAAIMAGATGFLLLHERRQHRQESAYRADDES